MPYSNTCILHNITFVACIDHYSIVYYTVYMILYDIYIYRVLYRCDWEPCRKLRSSPTVIAMLERGSLPVKFADIMLSVIDNKTADVERYV